MFVNETVPSGFFSDVIGVVEVVANVVLYDVRVIVTFKL